MLMIRVLIEIMGVNPLTPPPHLLESLDKFVYNLRGKLHFPLLLKSWRPFGGFLEGNSKKDIFPVVPDRRSVKLERLLDRRRAARLPHPNRDHYPDCHTNADEHRNLYADLHLYPHGNTHSDHHPYPNPNQRSDHNSESG